MSRKIEWFYSLKEKSKKRVSNYFKHYFKYYSDAYCEECKIPRVVGRKKNQGIDYLATWPRQEHHPNCSYNFRKMSSQNYKRILADPEGKEAMKRLLELSLARYFNSTNIEGNNKDKTIDDNISTAIIRTEVVNNNIGFYINKRDLCCLKNYKHNEIYLFHGKVTLGKASKLKDNDYILSLRNDEKFIKGLKISNKVYLNKFSEIEKREFLISFIGIIEKSKKNGWENLKIFPEDLLIVQE